MTTTLAPIATVVTETTWTTKNGETRSYRTGHLSNDCPRLDDGTIVGLDVDLASRDAGLLCDTCGVPNLAFVRQPGENDEPRREYGNGGARRAPVAPRERTNRYAGKCADCSGWVEAEAGLLGGGPGAWFVKHRDGGCPVVEPAPVASTPTPTVRSEAVEGIHRISGDRIVKVQRGRESGNLYAKLLVVTETDDGEYDGEFLYAPGLIVECSAETALSLDDARAYGALYSVCCVCAARLSDEDSIALGIGPVCGGRVYEWATKRKLTVAQVRFLAKLVDGPQPVGRSGRTVNVLVEYGLARLVDVDGVLSVEAAAA